jgi:succinate-semialdehyde dehydrogenase/glutarate-semialdehyde dehydrogenase
MAAYQTINSYTDKLVQTLKEHTDAELEVSADILDYYADNAEKFLAPEKLDVDEGEAFIENTPLGVLFSIEPWNFPYYQLARVAGPNLMAGNTLVVKHAPNVPQCALAFEKLFQDAGGPVGVYTNVFISNDQSAAAIADKRIKGVALTGSERAGEAVASEAGKALKKSTMELGGSDAFIVLDDADMDTAVKWGVGGRINNTGQCCVAAKRFILTFLERFQKELKNLVPGDPKDPKTTLGPRGTRSCPKTDRRSDSSRREGAFGGKTARPARLLSGADDFDRYKTGKPSLLSGVLRPGSTYLPCQGRE